MIEKGPQVGIIMGSDSDLQVMSGAAKILDEFGVSYEIGIVSAHRTPFKMIEYSKDASKKGLKVIVAGAGGAAHLPGMVAALTVLPVIGVPIETKDLHGMDSLLSIVQMPKGVPVAVVAINGAPNAGILAVRILAVGNKELTILLEKYRDNIEWEVIEKDKKLQELGFEKYLTQK